ncbi:hypothetical protein JCM12141A_08930 [Mycolicibacterium hodleri]
MAANARQEKRNEFTPEESKRVSEIKADLDHLKSELARSGHGDPEAEAVNRATAGRDSQQWATRAASAIRKANGGSESRAVTSGSVNVESAISPEVTPKSRPSRLLDLLVTRDTLADSPHFEYWRQTARTTAAAPVADLATKPTSTYTVTAQSGKAVVIAHLSDPVPIRLWQDDAAVIQWLENEMVAGVYDALETQIISGSGTGENLTGILTVAGTTQVAFATDVPTTLRKAQTALQTIGVTPDALVLNPADAEALDLLKEGTGGIGYLLDGFENPNARSANVLGTAPRVISNSIPAGTAVLANWAQALKLLVRQDMTLDIDAGGDLFKQNAAIFRAETRVGLAHLHPASIAVVDLTA